jgi:hypothetical protein
MVPLVITGTASDVNVTPVSREVAHSCTALNAMNLPTQLLSAASLKETVFVTSIHDPEFIVETEKCKFKPPFG